MAGPGWQVSEWIGVVLFLNLSYNNSMMRMSTFSVDRTDLLDVTMSPAVENASLETDELGTAM